MSSGLGERPHRPVRDPRPPDIADAGLELKELLPGVPFRRVLVLGQHYGQVGLRLTLS
jgi:hypothetical protein